MLDQAPEGLSASSRVALLVVRRPWLVCGVVVAILSAVCLALFLLSPHVDAAQMERFGYVGLFATNFAGTAIYVPPAPGLSAVGQALIIALGSRLDPVSVALVGGAAMTLGELAPYAIGRGLRRMADLSYLEESGPFGRRLMSAATKVEGLMARYGTPTLFVLSVIPNPLYEFAGITAGSSRMKLWRFLLPTAAGKFLRAFLLAFLGSQIPIFG